MAAAPAQPTVLDPALVTLPEQDLKRPEFKPGTIENISKARAIALSIAQMITLPYRIWRYKQYDRPYLQEPDASKGKTRNLAEWVAHMRAQPWSRQMGLDRVPTNPQGDAPLVAILDSGVDYNHPVLHGSLWLNPAPTRDLQGREDRYGWDFISGDSRPNDDSYHGTQMASAVLAVAPHARILPVKIFNPYGLTSSAAIVAGVRYALDQGAKIVLCGWSTLRKSSALEEAAKLAEERGAVLVVSAGDFGWDLSVFPAYPSTLTRKFASVISVAALGRDGKLLNETAPIKPDPKAPHARKASYGKDFVTLAAPGQRVDVAEPRGEFSVESSSGVAAAFVAGALARVLSETGARTTDELREGLERVSVADPALTGVVQDGRRLQF
jgi:subtilisin family serine protease